MVAVHKLVLEKNLRDSSFTTNADAITDTAFIIFHIIRKQITIKIQFRHLLRRYT
jgi:hypothetical protein